MIGISDFFIFLDIKQKPTKIRLELVYLQQKDWDVHSQVFVMSVGSGLVWNVFTQVISIFDCQQQREGQTAKYPKGDKTKKKLHFLIDVMFITVLGIFEITLFIGSAYKLLQNQSIMNFLRTFFDSKGKKNHQKETQMQKRKQRLMLNTSNPTYLLPHTSHKKCQPIPLKKELNKNPSFDLQKAARSIPAKFVEIDTIKTMNDISDIQWGDLVGVIKKQDRMTKVIPKNCYQVPIGEGYEIGSLHSLRRKVLDSLVVFYEQSKEDSSMIDLMQSKEKLILVLNRWQTLVQMFVRLQYILVENFKDKLLVQFSHNLRCNIFMVQREFIVQFHGYSQFASAFRKKIKIINTQEETDRLIGNITVEEYGKIKNQASSWYFLEKRIQSIKKNIEDEEKLRKMEQEIQREIQETQNRKEQEPVQYNVKMEIDHDPEVKYFLRESQKETRESGSRQPEPQRSDFYYIISQCTGSEEEDFYNQGEDQKEDMTVELEVPEAARELYRCKSANLNHQFDEVELLDEFFTKY